MSDDDNTTGSEALAPRDRWLGAIFVAVAIAFQALWLGLPAFLLSLVLIVAYALWSRSTWLVQPRLRLFFAGAIALFVAHASEEFLTGFHRSLPALFGRPAWTDDRFLVFNGLWAAVFCLAALWLRPGRQLAVLVVLFFALAGGVGNGVFHLLLVVQEGGYFPGAWTAPLCFVAGVVLLRSLFRAP